MEMEPSRILMRDWKGFIRSSVAWGDYDGDGDLDILLTGRNSGGQQISKIYQNDG